MKRLMVTVAVVVAVAALLVYAGILAIQQTERDIQITINKEELKEDSGRVVERVGKAAEQALEMAGDAVSRSSEEPAADSENRRDELHEAP